MTNSQIQNRLVFYSAASSPRSGLVTVVYLAVALFVPNLLFANTPVCIATVMDGATGLSTDQAIIIEFSAPIDPRILPEDPVGTTQGPIQIFNTNSGAAQPMTISVTGDNRQVTLMPSVTLEAGTVYQLRLGTDLAFQNGCTLVDPHVRVFRTERALVNDFTVGVAGGVVGSLIAAAILAKICVEAGDLEDALRTLVAGYQHPELPTSMNFTSSVRDAALAEAQRLLANFQPGTTVIHVTDFQANIQAVRILALETISCFSNPDCPGPVSAAKACVDTPVELQSFSIE